MTSLHRLDDFVGGWFVGDFTPSLFANSHVEVCVKYFKEGASEAAHYQLTATEWTVIISGECIVGETKLGPGDIIEIPPLEVAGFRALTDVVVVAVKTPSIPSDKMFP